MPAGASGPGDPRETELDDGRMPFVEHLRELRLRLRNAAIFFLIGVIGSWAFAGDIYDWLRQPLERAWAKYPAVLGPESKMAFASIVEPFWVDMSVALWAGIFVSSPFIFFQLWRFVAPGLYQTERQTGVWFSIFSAAFFVSGAAFCYYFVLEQLFTFLLGYADKKTQPVLMLREYFDLTRNMMLAFGAVFELPLLIYFLAKIGLVTHRGLWRFNRWFVVIAFVIGAILTPSPDVPTQVMMAVPMIVLYNLSIVVAWVVVRNREKSAPE
ncbi:MAG: twin-arginine translocase subunit TatC [Deltaproteobacteria bacterium]|nr:twin-arginine translocase subunit TatC [Kofleriaceae bacterium]